MSLSGVERPLAEWLPLVCVRLCVRVLVYACVCSRTSLCVKLNCCVIVNYKPGCEPAFPFACICLHLFLECSCHEVH